MKTIHILSLGSVVFLNACTQGNESFSTEPGQGFGWKSVTKNHEQIQKNMKEEDFKKNSQTKGEILAHKSQSMDLSHESVGRTSDQFVRVWFAPRLDAEGNLHEARAVQTLLKQGQWSINADLMS